MNITLFSSGCPRCNVLESKLKQKNIKFEINSDQKQLVELGRANKIMSAPILVVDGQVMDFSMANNWINEAQQEEENECGECKL